MLDLHRQTLLLLASHDVRAYETLKSAESLAEQSYPEGITRYYTGDDREAEDVNSSKDTLNDDELTAIYGAGL
jgi:hypothetical protein